MSHPQIAQRGITWLTCSRVRWPRLNSLIVLTNYCHLWGIHDLVCVMLSGGYLARFKLTRVSMTLSKMSDTCLGMAILLRVWIFDPMGAGVGAIFHAWVRPAPASWIGGSGRGFHFSLVGDLRIYEISDFDGFGPANCNTLIFIRI
jgi:hypothetical protein